MFIKEIHIDHFGQFDNYDLTLDRGINVIFGNNESGKTTIASFISYVFYGFDRGEKRYALSFSGNYPGGFLIVGDNDKFYRVARQKSGRSESCEILSMEDNSKIITDKCPGEYFFGINYDVFQKTFYVSQKNGAAFDCKTLKSSIENLITSADEDIDVQKAIKKLDAFRVELLHKNEKGGQIFELKEKLAKLKIKLVDAKSQNEAIIELDNKINDAKLEINKRTKSAKILELIKKYFELSKLNSEFQTIKDDEINIEKLEKELDNTINENTFNGFVPDEAFISKIKDLKNRIDIICDSIKNEEEKYNGLVKRESDYEKEYNNCHIIDDVGGEQEIIKIINKGKRLTKVMRVLSSITLFLTLAFSAVSIYVNIFDDIYGIGKIVIPLAIAFLIFTILLTAFSFVPSKKTKSLQDALGVQNEEEMLELVKGYGSTKETLVNLSGEVDLIEGYLKEKKDQRSNITDELKNELGKWGQNDYFDTIEKYDTFVQRKKEIDDSIKRCKYSQDAKKSILEKYKREEIENALSTMKEEFSNNNIDIGEYSIVRVEKELNFLVGSLDSFNNQRSRNEQELIRLKALFISPVSILDEIEQLENELKEKIKEFNAISLATQKIIEASESIRNNFSPQLLNFAQSYLSNATNGKYDSINFDEDMTLMFQGQDEVKHKVEFMSAGTIDCVYLSLRFALIDVIAEDKKLFSIFDESFSKMDDERLLNILNVLGNYSNNGNQLLILTSQKREVDLLEKINKVNIIEIVRR